MSDPELHYSMVFTGQGMGNLLSLTHEKDKAIQYAALVDCGSSSSTRGLIDESLDFLYAYIDNNRKAHRKYDFDLLVISHSDDDHWSLIPALINRYNVLRIGTFVYGNAKEYYTKRRPYEQRTTQGSDYNVIDDLLKTANIANFVTLPNKPISHFDKGGVVLGSATLDGARFDIVAACANVTSTLAASSGKARNTGSICVSVLRTVGTTVTSLVMLPGDMTYETIGFLQNKAGSGSFFAHTWVLSCPHHGSRNSIADNYNHASGSYTLATWFAGHVDPSALAVSAGFTTHRHPYKTVVQQLGGKTGRFKGNDHNYVVFDDGSTPKYVDIKTDQMIYTSYNAGLASAGSDAWRFTANASRYVFTMRGNNLTVAEVKPNAAPQPGLARGQAA